MKNLLTPPEPRRWGTEKLYSISEASHLLGIHPSTLRLWEKQNQVFPQRTSSGERIYTAGEINKLLKKDKRIHRGPSVGIPSNTNSLDTSRYPLPTAFSFSSGQLLILLSVFLLGILISIGAITFLYPNRNESSKVFYCTR